MGLLFAGWVVLVCVWSAGFVGVKCYSAAPATRPPAVPPPDGVAGYTRAEAFTYLTLPEWFIVYSTDEYAAFIATGRPSGFPYLGSIRQYWGFYASACAETRRRHPFETGYHVMLGVIGASFTIESSIRYVYEHTFGAATEWISSTDTGEDALARRTAREYGAFMHRTPWYEFSFASRLAALWREVPWTGPHMLRKIERRMALTAEYAIKAAYGLTHPYRIGRCLRGREPPHLRARRRYAPAGVVGSTGHSRPDDRAGAIHRHAAALRGLHGDGVGVERQRRAIHGHRRQ